MSESEVSIEDLNEFVFNGDITVEETESYYIVKTTKTTKFLGAETSAKILAVVRKLNGSYAFVIPKKR